MTVANRVAQVTNVVYIYFLYVVCAGASREHDAHVGPASHRAWHLHSTHLYQAASVLSRMLSTCVEAQPWNISHRSECSVHVSAHHVLSRALLCSLLQCLFVEPPILDSSSADIAPVASDSVSASAHSPTCPPPLQELFLYGLHYQRLSRRWWHYAGSSV